MRRLIPKLRPYKRVGFAGLAIPTPVRCFCELLVQRDGFVVDNHESAPLVWAWDGSCKLLSSQACDGQVPSQENDEELPTRVSTPSARAAFWLHPTLLDRVGVLMSLFSLFGFLLLDFFMTVSYLLTPPPRASLKEFHCMTTRAICRGWMKPHVAYIHLVLDSPLLSVRLPSGCFIPFSNLLPVSIIVPVPVVCPCSVQKRVCVLLVVCGIR